MPSKDAFTSINATCKLATRIDPQGSLFGLKQIQASIRGRSAKPRHEGRDDEFGVVAKHGAKRTRHVASNRRDRARLAVIGKPRRRDVVWPADDVCPPEVQTSTQRVRRVSRSAAKTVTDEVEYLNSGKQLPSPMEGRTTEVPTDGRQPGQTQMSLKMKHHGRSNPITPCRSLSAAVREKIRTRTRKKDTVSETDDVFEIEFINDSGAGRCLFSEKLLKEQGINPKTWMKYCRESRNPMIFDTGGGEVDAAESLQIVSQLFGRQEAYNLTDAPIRVPQGKIVLGNNMPYVWIPGRKTLSGDKQKQVEAALSLEISDLREDS